jgi:hypothetical protein
MHQEPEKSVLAERRLTIASDRTVSPIDDTAPMRRQ